MSEDLRSFAADSKLTVRVKTQMHPAASVMIRVYSPGAVFSRDWQTGPFYSR